MITEKDGEDAELSFQGMAAPWYKYRKDGKAGREILLALKKE